MDDGPLAEGRAVRFRATATNTDDATIAYNGGSAIACRTITGVALPPGYIRTDADTVAIYDGTYWIVDRQEECGSNANGSFVRFPGGLQLCYHYDTSSVTDTRTWTYPAAFNASTFPQATPIQGVSVPRTVHFVTRGATSANYRVYDQSGNASNTNVSLMAWGTY